MNKPFQHLIQQIKTFSTERDWEQFHNEKDLATALAIEASELLELFLWIEKKDLPEFMNDPKNREEVADEVADVLAYLLEFVDVTSIDLEQAFTEKFRKNALKYPVNKSKGNKTKYTKL